MSKKDDLINLLADKYGKKKENIKGTTPINDIINDKELPSHVETLFRKKLSSRDVENLTDIDSLVALL
ncbi:hypothetical protein JYG34_16195 [Pseudomonas entomophila]|uniref:hypothetical protein n=1 Tax=Pseudomonas entomophila TaxID=312306 RepID=UPI001BD02E40|nr:hypothetical protein [Pseudomonas entomophila]QVM89564.1 hypothetical protein JYG34_16195 [Pseudomonas entomophila]